MARLKGVIFSLSDVIVTTGSLDQAILGELSKLVKWLVSVGIEPVFVGNNPWFLTSDDGTRTSFQDFFDAYVGKFSWFIASESLMPNKPFAGAMQFVLQQKGWAKHEAVYVGNSEIDMRTARNGELLFLNALWHGQSSPYGFQFRSPVDIARFIDCFYLKLDDWFWKIEDGDLRVYSIAPFSTLSQRFAEAKEYSQHAKDTSKLGTGDPEFWGRLLASSVYKAGISEEINFVTSYPGHSTSSRGAAVNDALEIFADCVRARFIPNLIVRHTNAQKSQTARTSGIAIGVKNQVDTIHLNQFPRKTKAGEPYVRSPLGRGKTVLVVDDFCTAGNSFEAARWYLQSTGARVISLSWLKTINTDYQAVENPGRIKNPYTPNQVASEPAKKTYYYSTHVRNHRATSDLSDIFDRYYSWTWPVGL